MPIMTKRLILVGAASLFLYASSLRAGTLWWDTDGSTTGDNTSTCAGLGGVGNWSTAVNNWWDGVSSSLAPWTESSDAIFCGTPGLVTLSGPRTAGNLTFLASGF